MNRIASALVVFLLFFSSTAALVSLQWSRGREWKAADSRYGVVKESLARLEKEVVDPTVFHEESAASYINEFADAAYAMRGDFYTPMGEEENRAFLRDADLTAQQIFNIRVLLNRRLAEFQRDGVLGDETVDAFRRAHLYLSYAADSLIARRDALRPILAFSDRKPGGFFSYESPRTLVNQEIFPEGRVSLQAGDLILVRGASFISATIARIGDVVTNMSHLAMVAEAPDGKLKVVEALMERNVVAYDLQDYLDLERLPRVAIYRAVASPAKKFAREAARELWRIYEDSQKNPSRYRFDLQMNLHDNGKIFCAKLSRQAWERASGGTVVLPSHLTSFSAALKTDFAKGIQMQVEKSFAPADVEVDPTFELIAEYRDIEMLAESRRFDVVLSILFAKFKEGFTYRPDIAAGFQAVAAIFARDLGFDLKQIPADAKVETMATLIRHRDLVAALMEELKELEEETSLRLRRPLSYVELEELFEKACAGKCVERRSSSKNKAVPRTGRAISTERTRGPSDRVSKPAFENKPTSYSVQPPSGPTASAIGSSRFAGREGGSPPWGCAISFVVMGSAAARSST